MHSIYYIDTNRYLKGADYKVWVNVFLAFHNGEGLHDSEYHKDYDAYGNVIRSYGWRSSDAYGGENYKINGSHGCVNMKHDDAITFYNHLKIDDKVLVKQ